MGGGERNSQPKSSNWSGYPKKRCANIGCKKRAKYEYNKKLYCKVCFKEEYFQD